MAGDVLLTLYGRRNCHLCEDMSKAVSELASVVPFSVTHVDIDSFPEIVDEYNEIVPVLKHGPKELARIRINEELVLAYLQQLS